MAQPWPTSDRQDGSPALVLRPTVSWGRVAAFGISIFVWIALTAVGFAVFLKQPLDRKAGFGTCAAIGLFLLAAGARLYLIGRFASIRVDHQGLVVVNALGLRHRLDGERLARIQQASFDLTIRSSFTLSYFLFLGRNGRTLMKLPSKWWPEQGIAAICQALGVPLSTATEVFNGPAFRRAYPGSIPWVAAHPRIACSLIGLGILPAILAALWLLSLLQGSG